jgi:site-specific DNA-methyltransferase (adenine-specific)
VNALCSQPLNSAARSSRKIIAAVAHEKTLAKKSFDPLWDRMLRVFGKANSARRVYTSKTIEGIVLIARLYEREAERWGDFLAERGVRPPRRGPLSRSPFHVLAKHVLEIDSDDDGTASRLAAILDQWRAQRDRVAPDQIPNWIAGQGGITQLYQSTGERHEFYKTQTNTPERIAQSTARNGADPTYYCDRHPDTTSPRSPERAARALARAHREPATATKNACTVRLYPGDCLDVMERIADHSVDLIATDLPYGTSGRPWDRPLDLARLWAQYRRIIKPYGPILLFGSQPYTSEIIMSAPQGWFRHEIIWEKNRAASYVHANARPMRVHENIEVFSEGAIGHSSRSTGHNMPYYPESLLTVTDQGRRTGYPRSVLRFPIDKPALHPMGKPVALLRDLIELYSRLGEVVLDSCMGGGSTGIASIQVGRSFIGIEKEKAFFENAEQRIRDVSRRLAGIAH